MRTQVVAGLAVLACACGGTGRTAVAPTPVVVVPPPAPPPAPAPPAAEPRVAQAYSVVAVGGMHALLAGSSCTEGTHAADAAHLGPLSTVPVDVDLYVTGESPARFHEVTLFGLVHDETPVTCSTTVRREIVAQGPAATIGNPRDVFDCEWGVTLLELDPCPSGWDHLDLGVEGAARNYHELPVAPASSELEATIRRAHPDLYPDAQIRAEEVGPGIWFAQTPFQACLVREGRIVWEGESAIYYRIDVEGDVWFVHHEGTGPMTDGLSALLSASAR